ncbi:tetratricopeptide repeat protein [Dyadobacter fanqingshengii]|uniref:Tetratricopeptide repeat protein n=1 Tax=Dyadobacter fanqingshengii TaxID=2906443 RepID=A0A9X1T9Y5_9BACT|nr:tetratricopeptide repeat protein [Dyadobacter fanqingshengii]MCF0040953.1 tetratricopeptide repeat protein [Dyadobacter fanqingshengii]USJ37315.1 tetratricopeptide repeat protein [Dyadobacter fanqingshengii]
MKRIFSRCFIIVCLLFSALSADAQFDHIINKTHAERYTDLRKFIDSNIYTDRGPEAYKSLETLKKVALRNNDQDLVMEADLMRIMLDREVHKDMKKKHILDLKALIAKSQKAGNMQIHLRSRRHLAHFYWYETKNYERAFEEYLTIHPLLKKISEKDFPEKAYFLSQIGEAYYFFADYKNAISFSREALTVDVIRDHRGVHNMAMNTIGLSYMKTDLLNSADIYFKKILSNVGIGDYAVWKGIAQGNLGRTAYLRGKYDEAVPLLEACVDRAVIISDHTQAAAALTLLSDIYFRQNNISKAEKTIHEAQKYVWLSRIKQPLELLYQVFGKINAAKGNFVLTNMYLDSATITRNAFEKDFNAMQMLRASEKAQLQAHKADMERVAAEKQIKTLERNILLTLVLLLLMVALYFYKTYYYKTREKQRIINDQLKKAEQELTFATIQLEEFTRSISEKNLLVEELSARYSINGSEETVQELQKITILTDEQWEYFRTLFEKIHVGYLSRLRAKLPGLTPAETRFMALARLDLTYKEMASTLGISVQSVRVIRHRIRKKLNLPEEADLKDVVSTI